MKSFKKLFALTLMAAMLFSLLTACGNNNNETTAGTTGETTGETTAETAGGTAASGQVYYLNFKPEVSDIWEEIAATYTEETGVPVKVVTAASGTYEQTLMSEIAKTDAPTLFQINGPVGLQNWKDYCLDLSDTDLYSWLLDQSLAVTDGDGVYGIPYVVESYGIIYNEEIMQKYFALEDKAVDVSSTEEIKSFDTLKAVVEDMTAKKDVLEIDGVFASTSFSAGEDWRWHTHLANLPIYYEFKDKGISDAAEIEFSYSDNFRNIFDLYINNSITESSMLGSKSVVDSMAEFALGQVAMVQNGNWAWADIAKVEGNTVTEDNIKFLPIYIGAEGEESQGLCTGTENFFSINSQVSEEDQAASIAFVEWLFSSDTGKDYVTNKLGFIAPFDTFADDEKPTDPLAQEVIRFMENDSLTSVSWTFTAFPSQTFKDNFGASLLQYAQGSKEWDTVVEDMVADWAYEKEASVTE